MLEIRKEQAEAYHHVMVEDFVQRGLKHVRKHLAGESRECSDDEVRRRIREGIPRAAQYGLASEQQVIFYVDTSFLLGEHFDRDPQYPWAAEILRSTKLTGDEKASVLFGTACSVSEANKAKKG
jgi:hypothetical protein